MNAATNLIGSSPLGILAAAGKLPLDIATAARRQNRDVHIVALRGLADPAVVAFPHEWAHLGQLNRLIGSFQRAGCRDLIIAGAMQRPNLWHQRIDAGFLSNLPTILKLTRGGDDGVLRRVVRFFEGKGFTVKGVADVAPDLLAPADALGIKAPVAADEAAIALGNRVIASLGPFDVGQAIVATASRIIAVEGIRGTDAMLAELGPGGSAAGLGNGAVLVKLAKPSQELRIDLPTIGPTTVERARAAGLSGIAVGSHRSIVLEREATAAAADAAGLFIVGVGQSGSPAVLSPRGMTPPMLTPVELAKVVPLAVMARRAPTPSERRDIGLARQIMPVLRHENVGRAVVVAREHVLMVAAALPVAPLLRPLGERNHWGLRLVRGQIGALVLDFTGLDNTAIERTTTIELFRAVRDARLAGVACLGRPIPELLAKECAAWANDGGFFLMGESP